MFQRSATSFLVTFFTFIIFLALVIFYLIFLIPKTDSQRNTGTIKTNTQTNTFFNDNICVLIANFFNRITKKMWINIQYKNSILESFKD
ncbi:MAG: hypothetical protein QG594_2504 [Bacteroidota bacterium]|nr:hypothetical protein [Bacteroidota bacterium]